MNCCVNQGIFYEKKAMRIELKDVSKTYQERILYHINHSFEGGKLYVIKGVSGCGKTTLLNIIGGIDPEFKGEIIAPEGARCAYVFQQSLLLGSLTIRENLHLIRNDAEMIGRLAEELEVSDLLDRMPETLSGGERQRISVIRALLKEPDVLLADEPTAALDGQHAEAMAALIAGLRANARIILVATHDPYFDAYADEILDLDYGTLRSVRQNDRAPAESYFITGSDEEAKQAEKTDTGMFSDFCIIMKRRPELFRLKNLLLGTVFIFLILFVSSVQKNIAAETIRLFSQAKPVDLLLIPREQMSILDEKDIAQITFFEDYYAEEGNWTGYYLLPETYSVLALRGMLSYGSFPDSDSEILVNETLAAEIAGEGNKLSDAIGRTISFCGLSLTVKGIVGTYLQDFRLDYYYRYDKSEKPLDVHDKHLFIPYGTLKEVGRVLDRPVIMAVWPGLYQNREARERLEERGFNFNQYYQDAESLERSALVIEMIIYAVLIVLFFVTCLYSVSLIRLELFYRRKETGYLQIFGVSQTQIQSWTLMEYGVRFISSLLLAVVIHGLMMLGYTAATGVFPWPNIPVTLLMVILLAFLYIMTVHIVSRRFLKHSIIQLIA